MRSYVEIKLIDITDAMIGESVGTSESIEVSKDGVWAILKFNTPFPNSMAGHIKRTPAQQEERITNNPALWGEYGE